MKAIAFVLTLGLLGGGWSWATGASSSPKADAGAVPPESEVLSLSEREGFFLKYFDRLNAPKPLARFQTRNAWLRYRTRLADEVRACLGLSPWPERAPLVPEIAGRLEHEGITIERVYYQVLPGVYASGYLYLPEAKPGGGAGQGRFPAVLNPHGHWELGAVAPVVQARCLALAKLGYVAFCPDSTHVMDLAVGLCPIGLMTWNNLRAVDFLQSLDCVDPARIGCTGESGGGQQTLYLGALDERVRVLAPAVLVSYFRRILFSTEQTHCFCNHAPGMAAATDETELAAMLAPRPTRFICATGDWTRDFPREEFPEIRSIYALVGGEVDCVQFAKPHNYDRDSRERMYAWMNWYLKGETNQLLVPEPEVRTLAPERLRGLGTPLATGQGLEGAVAYWRQHHRFREPVLSTAAAWRAYRRELRKQAYELLGEPASATRPLKVSSRGTFRAQGLLAEKWLLDTEPTVSVPGWLFQPSGASGRGPAVVIAHPEGQQALLRGHTDLVQALVGQGTTVLAIDTRLRGELHRKWYWNTVIWGRPEEGMAAHDLNAALTWLRGRRDVDPESVYLLGFGALGKAALFAGALDEHWAGVVLAEVGPLYAETSGEGTLPRVLCYGDLPQFASLLAPRPLWLNGAGARFGFTAAAYQACGQAARFRCSDLSEAELKAAFIRWRRPASETAAWPDADGHEPAALAKAAR